MRPETQRQEGADMTMMVEYGLNDDKIDTMARVHIIIKREGGVATHAEELNNTDG